MLKPTGQMKFFDYWMFALFFANGLHAQSGDGGFAHHE